MKNVETVTDIKSNFDKADLFLCKQVVASLVRHYDEHPWHVTADHKSGMVYIRLLYADKDYEVSQMGMALHIDKMKAGDIDKKIMRAGGELLERFNLARDHATAESTQQALTQKIDKAGAI